MDLQEMRRQEHLSVSAISGYIDCSLAYKLSRIYKLPPEATPDALVFGTAIHAVLAEYYEALKEGVRLSAKDLQECFTLHWANLAFDRDDIQYKPGKDYETLLLEGKELLAAFYHSLPQEDCQVLGVEQPFRFELEGLPLPIIGVYDLVLEDAAGVITIVDHKTTSRAYSANEIDQNFQLTVYQCAAKANGFKDREILLRFDCLVKTRTPKFEQYYTTRDEMAELMAFKKILAVWEGISKGVFIPNDTSWQCQGCGYKNACQSWFEGRLP